MFKTGYYLELLTPEIAWKIKNGENVTHLEITEVVLIYCNIFNNECQQDSRGLCKFVPNKPFGSLLEIWPTNIIFWKTFKSEFQEIDVWLTDQTVNHLKWKIE